MSEHRPRCGGRLGHTNKTCGSIMRLYMEYMCPRCGNTRPVADRPTAVSKELTRLSALAQVGEELVKMAEEMLEWAAMEHTDTCPLSQEHPADDASCDCLLGDMRRVIAAFEEASRV